MECAVLMESVQVLGYRLPMFHSVHSADFMNLHANLAPESAEEY